MEIGCCVHWKGCDERKEYGKIRLKYPEESICVANSLSINIDSNIFCYEDLQECIISKQFGEVISVTFSKAEQERVRKFFSKVKLLEVCKSPDVNMPQCSPISVLKSFSRQQAAFDYFDDLLSTADSIIALRKLSNIKFFSYECYHSGLRRFLVADEDSFLIDYINLAGDSISGNKHVYEIIRTERRVVCINEGKLRLKDDYVPTPCRLYFDLEYYYSANPPDNVKIPNSIKSELFQLNYLVYTWIQLVFKKLYSLFGISVGFESVVLLDSSTSDKFSQHIVLNIQNSSEKCSDEVIISGRELLFRDNIEVGKFVELIMRDITVCDNSSCASRERCTTSWLSFTDEELEVVTDINTMERCTCCRVGMRRPRKGAAHMWVRTMDESAITHTTFVDLGVYTRNRAFRLFLSSKYQKERRLEIFNVSSNGGGKGSDDIENSAVNDVRAINRMLKFSREGSSGASKRRKVEPSRIDLYRKILRKSYVVPVELSMVVDTKNDASSSSILTIPDILFYGAEVKIRPKWTGGRHIMRPSEQVHVVESVNINNYTIKALCSSSDCLSLTRCVDTLAAVETEESYVGVKTAGSKCCGHCEFTMLIASCTGTEEDSEDVLVQSVKHYRRCMLDNTTPTHTAYMRCCHSHFPGVDIAVLAYCSRDGVQGCISGWKLYAVLDDSDHNKPIEFKIKYQITNYHWCANVGRAHKSNHIIIEVNLNHGTLVQSCWDPQCRNFRSQSSAIPLFITGVDCFTCLKQYFYNRNSNCSFDEGTVFYVLPSVAILLDLSFNLRLSMMNY